MSDLHVDVNGTQDLDWMDAQPDCDLAIVAGDTHNSYLQGYEYVRNHIKGDKVLYLLGNHEFWNYYGDAPIRIHEKIEMTDGRVTATNDGKFHINGFDILLDTAWFNPANPLDAFYCERLYSDYQMVVKNHYGDRANTVDFAYRNNYFAKKLLDIKNPTIVVTHFAPSYKSVHKDFEKSTINAAYATELSHLMNDNIKLCVHGHMHKYFDYMIGNTRVICNPLGYGNERIDFSVVQIDTEYF